MNPNRNNKSGNLFVISAPSGAGKTSISMAALQSCKNGIKKVVTYTSRPPRPGEIDGVDYHFISIDEFKKRLENGFFLETNKYSGNYYGSPTTILDDIKSGKSFLMVTDRSGALVIKKLIPDSILIWLYVENLETLRNRLIARGTDNQETINQRIALAKEELAQETKSPVFDYHIENNKFEETIRLVKNIIQGF